MVLKFGVWTSGNYYTNWLKLKIYDSLGELIETRGWQNITTLTQDDGCYFEASMNHSTGTEVIRATWL